MLCLASTMLSCQSLVHGVQPTFTIGMSEKEFTEKNKQQLVLANDAGVKVYRTENFNQLTNFKFFYFKDGKLVRYEDGLKPDDYKLNWIP